MSGIRKYIRKQQALNKPKRTKAVVTKLDGLLIIGLTMSFVGILTGAFSYMFFSTGRPEGIFHSESEGTIYVAEETPGNLKYKQIAKYGVITGGIGLLVSGAAWALKQSGNKDRSIKTEVSNKPLQSDAAARRC
jgi:hypothetical protein